MNKLGATLIILLLLAGCTDTRTILGEAYVAPAVLHLRAQLANKSSNVADLKHGDHLQIVDVQRRMVRVRTDKGQEGWVDSIQLLSPEQMDELKQRRRMQATLAAEGSATAYEILNIHIDPDRQSPAFAQIPEGGAVTVLGHRITPKNQLAREAGLVISRPQTLSRKQRKEQQIRSLSFRLPPRPAPPKPPVNWQELSAERIDGAGSRNAAATKKMPAAISRQKPEPAKQAVPEDWTLVRTKRNETGWVLTRNLLMGIPDEVAQYAEGKHIVAFFDLGQVNDAVKGPKHNWLWATASFALAFDYDSWRVFLWNTRHHRYETSFRKRDIEGHFPIHVETPDPGSPLRTFELVTKDEDGKMRRRTYTFDGHLVHLANTEDYNEFIAAANATASALNPKDLASKASQTGWFKRQWFTVRQRLFGK